MEVNFLYILTTLSLDELSYLLKQKKVSTNNVEFISDQEGALISEYLKQKLGYNGFVLGIVGQISLKNIEKLKELDPELNDAKVALEIKIPDNEAIYMNENDIIEVADFIDLGMDSEDILDQIDTAITNGEGTTNNFVCIPYIPREHTKRLTSLTQDIQIDNIAFVKVNQIKED